METNVLKMESFWQKHKKYAAEVYEIGTNVTGKQHGYGKYRQGKAELICELFEIPMEPFLQFSMERPASYSQYLKDKK